MQRVHSPCVFGDELRLERVDLGERGNDIIIGGLRSGERGTDVVGNVEQGADREDRVADNRAPPQGEGVSGYLAIVHLFIEQVNDGIGDAVLLKPVNDAAWHATDGGRDGDERVVEKSTDNVCLKRCLLPGTRRQATVCGVDVFAPRCRPRDVCLGGELIELAAKTREPFIFRCGNGGEIEARIGAISVVHPSGERTEHQVVVIGDGGGNSHSARRKIGDVDVVGARTRTVL